MATNIQIYKRLTSGTDADYTLHSTVDVNATSETVSGLTPSTSYTFKIIREIAGDQSSPVVVSATTNASGTVAVPTITGFSPTTGLAGDSITITGTNFTGATAVTVNSVAATSFSVVSATSITATVPAGTTGKVRVTTAGGTAVSSADFTYIGGGETPGEEGSTGAEIITDYHTLTARPAPELSPLVTFANTIETAGFYDKMVTGYLLNGGSETANKYNIFDPSPEPGSLTATFVGTVTHESDGVLFAASSGYLDSGVLYVNVPNAPDLGLSWYTKDLITGSIIGDNANIVLYPFDPDGNAYNYMAGDMAGSGVPVTYGNKRGFKTVQREGDYTRTYHSAAEVAEKYDPVLVELGETNTIKLHYGYPGAPHNQTVSFSFFAVHQALTPTEQAIFFNAVETLMTDLSINVTP